MTVPGVNVIVAATFMAAVGDIRRFPDRRKLTAYLGLDPRVRQSGNAPAAHGHISKQGSASARHALVEACWSTVRQPGPIAGFYQRVRARRGHSIAIVASARKLACLFWCSAHPRRGLRVRAAVADQEEDAPPRARRPAPRAGRAAAASGRPTTRCATPNASSRSRPSAPTNAPSKTASNTQGASATPGRASNGSSREQVARQTTGPSLRFDSSSPAPDRTLPRQAAIEQADLTFIRRPTQQRAAVGRGADTAAFGEEQRSRPPRLLLVQGSSRSGSSGATASGLRAAAQPLCGPVCSPQRI